MLEQTGGEWSAPLDDVFIHFDYARSTALGHPFEWTVGNGYSSGNTSLTYPLVLAVGWLFGFRGRSLMIWAAIVAATCTFGVLLAVRRLLLESEHDAWGRISSYFLPPIFLGVGAFVWSLWSGMEVAFFMATWAIALLAWQRLERDAKNFQDLDRTKKNARMNAWWLGAAGVLLVTTRPEAALTLAVFGVAAALAHRSAGMMHALGILVRAGLPGAIALCTQSVGNKIFTGEWTANGAIVKLAIYNPYMSVGEKLADYISNLKYASLRNLEYHFAHIEGEHLRRLVPQSWPTANPLTQAWAHLARQAWWAGVVPLALAMLPLAFTRTRRIAVVLWAEIVLWVVVVACNGQVRWQNERYIMPAVGILLILVTLGVSVALRTHEDPGGRGHRAKPSLPIMMVLGVLVAQIIGVLTRPGGAPAQFRLPWEIAIACGVVGALALRFWPLRALFVTFSLLFAYDHQIAKMRDQKWFFGRACRNIRDQHLAIGRYLAEIKPRRVLVGDAGAILYESNRPGLDIIGLGGYGKLPFARAGVHGLAASLELIERVPDGDRPDVLAIFPSWWGVLPTTFSSELLRRFPVEGNVICGGYEQNVYRADWQLLGTGSRLRTMPVGDTRIAAEIDILDLVSEKENNYSFDKPQNGWAEMRILPDPTNPALDMFDGGRRITAGKGERFVAKGLVPGKAAHLVVRTAPEHDSHVRVHIEGVDVGTLHLSQASEWVEAALAIPAERVTEPLRVELTNDGPGDFVDFHAWLTQ